MRRPITSGDIKEFILRETLLAKILKKANSGDSDFSSERSYDLYWDIVDSIGLEMPKEREAIYYSIAISALIEGKMVSFWFPNDRLMTVALRKGVISIMPDSPEVLPSAKQIKQTVKCLEDYIAHAKKY